MSVGPRLQECFSARQVVSDRRHLCPQGRRYTYRLQTEIPCLFLLSVYRASTTYTGGPGGCCGGIEPIHAMRPDCGFLGGTATVLLHGNTMYENTQQL